MTTRLERWAKHFEEVLVTEAPTNPVEENEVELNVISEMDTIETREAKVGQALRQRVEEHLESTVSQQSCTKLIVMWR